MKDRITDLLTIVLPYLVVAVFFAAFLLTPDRDYSEVERRVLAQKPVLNQKSVTDGTYMEAFESYVADQFPQRELFLKCKAAADLYLFRHRDHRGYYLADGHLSKLETSINEQRLRQSVKKHRNIYESYLKGTDCKIYQAIIPDKNYYLAAKNGYPVMDYDSYRQKVKDGLPYADDIDLFDCLSLNDYYRTDPHWRQECLGAVVQRIHEEMKQNDSPEYQKHTLGRPFYGAYYSQSAIHAKADEMTYLTSDEMEDWIVTSYNTGIPQKVPIYDLKKVGGRDPYEMFLNGSDALLVIDNPHAESTRELVIFRDSFGSSLAPLLVCDYKKVTLIDLRYIRSEALKQFVSFDRQDVLLIYSTLVF